MKKLIYCLWVLGYQTIFAQSKPNQSNPVAQTQVTSVVTICNQFGGKLRKADILAKPYLTIQNNTLKWNIIQFNYQFMAKAKTIIGVTNTTNLPIEVTSNLKDAYVGSYLFIFGIKAINKNNDTCYLPAIAVQLKD